MKILRLLFLSVAITSALTSGVILSSISVSASDTESDKELGRETEGGVSRPLSAVRTICPAPSSSSDTALSAGTSSEDGPVSTFVGHRPMPLSDLGTSQAAPGRDERPPVYDHGSGREGSCRFESERVVSFRDGRSTLSLTPHADHEGAPRRGAPLDISASTTGFSDRSTRSIVIPAPPLAVASFFSGSGGEGFDLRGASARPSPTGRHEGRFDDSGRSGGAPWAGSTRSFGAQPPSPTFGRDIAAAAGFSASGGASLGSAHGGGSSRSPLQQHAPLFSPGLGSDPTVLAFVHHAAASSGFHPGTSAGRGVGGHGFGDEQRASGGTPIGLLSTLIQGGGSCGLLAYHAASGAGAPRLLRAIEMSEVTRTMPSGVIHNPSEGVWEYSDRDGALWASSTPPSRDGITRISSGRRPQFDIPCRQPEKIFEWLRTQCAPSSTNLLARYTIGARGVRLVGGIVATRSVEGLFSGLRREVAEKLGYVLPVLLCHAQFAQFDYALPVLLQRGFLVESSRRMDSERGEMYKVGENPNIQFAINGSFFRGYDGIKEDGFVSAEGVQWLYTALLADRRFRY